MAIKYLRVLWPSQQKLSGEKGKTKNVLGIKQNKKFGHFSHPAYHLMRETSSISNNNYNENTFEKCDL